MGKLTCYCSFTFFTLLKIAEVGKGCAYILFSANFFLLVRMPPVSGELKADCKNGQIVAVVDIVKFLPVVVLPVERRERKVVKNLDCLKG